MRNIRWVYYKLTGFKLNLAYCFFFIKENFLKYFHCQIPLGLVDKSRIPDVSVEETVGDDRTPARSESPS